MHSKDETKEPFCSQREAEEMKNRIDVDEILILGQRMGFFREHDNGYFLSENSKKFQLCWLKNSLEKFVKNEQKVKGFLSLVGNPSISEKEFDYRILDYTINETSNSFSKVMKENFENIKNVGLSSGQAPPVVILGVGFLLREMCLEKGYMEYSNGRWYAKLK